MRYTAYSTLVVHLHLQTLAWKSCRSDRDPKETASIRLGPNSSYTAKTDGHARLEEAAEFSSGQQAPITTIVRLVAVSHPFLHRVSDDEQYRDQTADGAGRLASTPRYGILTFWQQIIIRLTHPSQLSLAGIVSPPDSLFDAENKASGC